MNMKSLSWNFFLFLYENKFLLKENIEKPELEQNRSDLKVPFEMNHHLFIVISYNNGDGPFNATTANFLFVQSSELLFSAYYVHNMLYSMRWIIHFAFISNREREREK